MVTLLLDSTQLEVVLSPFERTLSRRSDPVRVRREHILKVQLTDDAWTWLRGVASPGTLIRGTIAMGAWRSAGADDFVIVRRRRPAVVIDLADDEEFARLVLTTRHGLALVQALRLEGEDAPVEVGEPVPAPARPRGTRAPAPA
ncbi:MULTISPECIES: hypothetical protein [unclassified Microbacterium]|uniref:hypothetical protein n=1 Tax=unclassified Microbacterium TaxID=2609290 RepID=UPI003018D446